MKKLGMGKLWMLQGESTPNILDSVLISKEKGRKIEHFNI